MTSSPLEEQLAEVEFASTLSRWAVHFLPSLWRAARCVCARGVATLAVGEPGAAHSLNIVCEINGCECVRRCK
jgi:hypothetical protein